MKQENKMFFPHVTVMNALLCLFVVMIHCTGTPYSELSAGTWQHITIFSLNKLLTFSVPAFLFLSGFKLYKDSDINVWAFYKRRFIKIVVPYIIAALIYILYFFKKGWLDGNFFEYLFLGTISAHFYYVMIAVQLYLLFPLILWFFRKHSITTGVLSAIMTVIFSCFLYHGFWDRFFGQYIFYFVFGMLWKKYGLGGKTGKFMPLVVLAYLAVTTFHLRMMYLCSFYGANYDFSQIVNIAFVLLSTVLLYVISEKVLIKSKAFSAASTAVSASSYSIYLYHCLLLYILQFDVFTKFSLTCGKRFIITLTVLYSVISLYCLLNSYIKRKKIPN